MPAFKILRQAQRPALSRTYSAEMAARVIVNGFEKRSRRICVPEYLRVVHALWSLLTSRPFECDQLVAAPEMEKAFAETQTERGTEPVSQRTAAQIKR
jgi:hypothetical protein